MLVRTGINSSANSSRSRWFSWLTVLTVASLVTPIAWSGVHPAYASPDAGAADSPAKKALIRVVGKSRASQVKLRTVRSHSGPDRFRISTNGGRLVVQGTSPAAQLTGFGWYLRHVAHADVALTGSQTNLPRQLPLPSHEIAHKSSVDHRFALNDTNEGYAGAYLSWSQWQHRIDVFALHGINDVLVYEGQEAVYEQTLQAFNYTAKQAREWIPQPAHQPWWLLQNMCCVGSPISQHLINTRVQLAQKITQRLRDLGMTPVLPGYYGIVPTDFTDHNPGANTVAQGKWNDLTQPDWLDPTDPYFPRVAKTFYRVQRKLFGDTTMYKMDLLHEGGKAGDVDVGDASKAVQHALNKAHPEALWTILGWQSNPRTETLKAVNRKKMFIVDGISEKSNITNRDKDFLGTPYAFGTIWNFGGNSGIGASLSTWNKKFHKWQKRSGDAMNGIALMPEAIDNNPAALAFFTDMPWVDGPVNMHKWFDNYAKARYGGSDRHARAAWNILRTTVYDWPANKTTHHVTALFDDQPSLNDKGVPLQYDPDKFAQALNELLKVSPSLRRSSAYRYDLVDVARQVLANNSREILPEIKNAYLSKDRATFNKLTDKWMRQLQLMDKLLGTSRAFLLGPWQKEASRQAGNRSEAAALDYDLKSLLTMWSKASSLQDYAKREVNGLVGDYYAKRWHLLFDRLSSALATGKEPKPINWKTIAVKWSEKSTKYSAEPKGDAYTEARKVAELPSAKLNITAEHKGAIPGTDLTLKTTFKNNSQTSKARNVKIELRAPKGYHVSSTGSPVTRSVPPNDEFSTTWKLHIPKNAESGAIKKLTARTRWTTGTRSISDRQSATARDTTEILVGGKVSRTYRTVSNTPAVFGEHGDTTSIAAGGEDLWKDTARYAASYQDDALSNNESVATKVVRQDGSSAYTRSGLIISNDLSTTGNNGVANIAVTPDHGCMFSWDSNGDGKLNKYTEVGGFSPTVYVRLSKDDAKITASCSSDGKNWATIGTGTTPHAKSSEDVGMFVSAVNRNTHDEALASFVGGIQKATPETRDGSDDTLQSLNKPVTALDSEKGHPASAANDGSRGNHPYWGGPLTFGKTWWQVDLGAVTDISRINVRNYVDGSRIYTYQIKGSRDGEHWFTLGGRSSDNPASDAGGTIYTQSRAQYVRVVGLSNTANPTFHLTEVSVYGEPTEDTSVVNK